MGKINTQKNESFLKNHGVKNKTHLNVLSKYDELLMVRIIVIAIAFFSLMTTVNYYVFCLSFLYIGLEIFFYRYYKNLQKHYGIEKVGNAFAIKIEREK